MEVLNHFYSKDFFNKLSLHINIIQCFILNTTKPRGKKNRRITQIPKCFVLPRIRQLFLPCKGDTRKKMKPIPKSLYKTPMKRSWYGFRKRYFVHCLGCQQLTPPINEDLILNFEMSAINSLQTQDFMCLPYKQRFINAVEQIHPLQCIFQYGF